MNALNAAQGSMQCRFIREFWEGPELVQMTVTELMVKDFAGNLVRCVCFVSHPVHSSTK